MKILKEIKYPLLNRKRYSIEMEHLGKTTPKNADLKNEIAGFLKHDANLISIKHIYSRFGQGISKAIVHVYDNEKEFKLFEIEKVKANGKPENKEQKTK